MHVRAIVAVTLAVGLAAPHAALAADLPAIKISDGNAVPECVTPGRLMAFIRSRNTSLDPRFEKIAVTYMRTGEELKLRWDIAFYQMAVETSYLTFKREGGRPGDVKPSQNNFAGMGATGNGVPGESFPDVEAGVRAHLEHVLVYSGETVENAVAERTRNLQKWSVLRDFHKKIKGPVTYAHLAQRWATSSQYAAALETHGRRFETDFCKAADPNPELLAEVRGDKPKVAEAQPKPERKLGKEFARRAIEEAPDDGSRRRAGLGAAGLAKQNDPAKPAEAEAKPQVPAGPAVTILNAPPKLEVYPLLEAPAVAEAPAKPEKPKATEKADKPKAGDKAKTAETPMPAVKTEKPQDVVPYQTASAGALVPKKQPSVPAVGPSAAAKCKVFTASYGGLKAILIKAPAEGGINYTVLDVNDGNERSEADAYIAAYAKGGEVAGEFPNPNQALDKAFELCPEG
ncbi:MAG: hypothetical protein ACKVP7_06610 [Hyphomicrobiaceae bacterium]